MKASTGAFGSTRWTSRRTRVSAIVLAVVLATTVTGCSQTAIAPEGSCSPAYKVGGAEGGLNVQQRGKGQAIQWGIYVAPEYKTGTAWTVTVRANGTKLDFKEQSYEPHGSVSAARAAKYSGKTLEISGTAVHKKDDVLTFSGKCTIA